MTKIIVTGCSYSQKSGVPISYPDVLDEVDGISVTNLAWPGQSNDTIIRNVKEQIRSGVTDTLFICQLTHLHRISHFCTLNQKWVDFQPSFVNVHPTIKNDNITFDIDIHYGNKDRKPLGSENIGALGVYGAQHYTDVKLPPDMMIKLLEWYEQYLVYIYDEKNVFFELHHTIDELTKQVKDSGNDILYLYWPEDTSYDVSLFGKNNFLCIDGHYSMLKWSFNNSLILKEDSHLSVTGHYKLANFILSHIGISNKIQIPIL